VDKFMIDPKDEDANYCGETNKYGPMEKDTKCFKIDIFALFRWFKNKKNKEIKTHDNNR